MKKIPNHWLYVGVGIGLGVIVLCLTSSKKDITEALPNTSTETGENKKEAAFSSILPSKTKQELWPLKKGSKGHEVERLQIWLLRHHGWQGNITKVFDEQTEALVKKHLKTEHVDRATYQRYQMETPIHEQVRKAINNGTKEKKTR